MEGHADRNLKLSSGAGCAGKAFTERKPFEIDLSRVPHSDYLVDSTKVWPAMKSVLSVPIFDSGMNEPIAILSVDSSLPGADMKFQERLPNVNMFADLIGAALD